MEWVSSFTPYCNPPWWSVHEVLWVHLKTTKSDQQLGKSQHLIVHESSRSAVISSLTHNLISKDLCTCTFSRNLSSLLKWNSCLSTEHACSNIWAVNVAKWAAQHAWVHEETGLRPTRGQQTHTLTYVTVTSPHLVRGDSFPQVRGTFCNQHPPSETTRAVCLPLLCGVAGVHGKVRAFSFPLATPVKAESIPWTVIRFAHHYFTVNERSTHSTSLSGTVRRDQRLQ